MARFSVSRFKTDRLRDRIESACAQRRPDVPFLHEVLRQSPRLADPAAHAPMIHGWVTPTEITPKLRHDINAERFGFAGVRMLYAAETEGATLFLPVGRDGSAPTLVMLDVRGRIATMATEAGGEQRVDPNTVEHLLLDEWRNGRPKMEMARGLILDMGISLVSAAESSVLEGYDASVAVSDDYDVSKTLVADAVIVCTKGAATLYEDEDLAVFRRDKIRLIADPDNGILMPDLKDKRLWQLLNFIGHADGTTPTSEEEGQILGVAVGSEVHDMMCEMTALPINIIRGLEDPMDGGECVRVLVTHRRYCPEQLPSGGEKLAFD